MDSDTPRINGASCDPVSSHRPEPRHHLGVFEQKVASPGKKPAQQHRLSGPARTGEHQSRKVANGFHHLLFQVSADIFYE